MHNKIVRITGVLTYTDHFAGEYRIPARRAGAPESMNAPLKGCATRCLLCEGAPK